MGFNNSLNPAARQRMAQLIADGGQSAPVAQAVSNAAGLFGLGQRAMAPPIRRMTVAPNAAPAQAPAAVPAVTPAASTLPNGRPPAPINPYSDGTFNPPGMAQLTQQPSAPATPATPAGASFRQIVSAAAANAHPTLAKRWGK